MTWAGALGLQGAVFAVLAIAVAMYRADQNLGSRQAWTARLAWGAVLMAALSIIAAGYAAVWVG